MRTVDRNRSLYAKRQKKHDFLDLGNRETWTPELLEKAWIASVKRDPIVTSYESINGKSLSGEATATALALLSAVTGDEAFRTALLALRAYGLDAGAVRQTLRRQLRGKFGARPAIRLVLPMMANWRRDVPSDLLAARLTAAQYGIPGDNFVTVVDELRKAFIKWRRRLETKEPADLPLTGDTGRKLKVRMATPWLGVDNLPLSEVRGVVFGSDGFGLAPDDGWWRQMIHGGHFHLCGVIERPEIVGKSLAQ